MPNQEISILLIGCEKNLHQRFLEVSENRYELKSIADLELGISKAFKVVPDIILICSCLSLENIIGACRKLKNNQLTSHIPIILVLDDQAPLEDPHPYPVDALLPFHFSKKELILGLQKVISLKVQLMKRFAMFYNPENPFTREYALLSNHIEQLTD